MRFKPETNQRYRGANFYLSGVALAPQFFSSSRSKLAGTLATAPPNALFPLPFEFGDQVHPMVLFSVLDHYLRRPENQKRVIGTLLGTVTANVVEITNSFAVPHLEKNDEV